MEYWTCEGLGVGCSRVGLSAGSGWAWDQSCGRVSASVSLGWYWIRVRIRIWFSVGTRISVGLAVRVPNRVRNLVRSQVCRRVPNRVRNWIWIRYHQDIWGLGSGLVSGLEFRLSLALGLGPGVSSIICHCFSIRARAESRKTTLGSKPCLEPFL